MYAVDPIKRIVKPMSGHAVTEQDHEASSLRFAFPDNIAGTGLDSTGTAVRVMYIRPDGGDPVAKTLTFYKHSGGYYLYDWNLQKSDLQKEGRLVFSLCILNIAEGEVEEWHTTPCVVRVLSTIHTDDSDEGDESITPTVAQRVAVLETMIQRVASGAPIVVSSVSAMTDTEQIYVLSTDGNWYYHNGSAWVAGGEYGAASTDTTLTQAGIPADAEIVGDKIADLKADLSDVYTGDTSSLEIITKDNISEQFYVGNGIISGTVGNPISITQSTSYKYYKLPCDVIKAFSVLTREIGNKTSYIIETDTTGNVTIVHASDAPTSSPKWYVYDITASDNSAYLYVMIYTASGSSDSTRPAIYSCFGLLENNVQHLSGMIGDIASLNEYSSDVTYLKTITSGGIQGTSGNLITTTSSTSYAHMAVDCSVHKKFRITTRRSNSSTYPSYVIETTLAGAVIAIHEGKASTSNDYYTYDIEPRPLSKCLYVMCYRGGGSAYASYAPTVEYLVEDTSIIIDRIKTNLAAQAEKIDETQEELALTYADLETSLLQAAKQTVMGINRTAGRKLVNFAFITDTHINGYGTTKTYAKPSIDLFVKLCNEKYIDFCAFGGDMYSNYNLTHDEGLNAMGEVLTQFGKINAPLLVTKGNHECNGKYIKDWDMEETPEWSTYHYWVLNSDIDPTADGRSYVEVTSSTWDGETQLHYSVGDSSGYDSGSRFSRDDTIQDWEHSALSALRSKFVTTKNPADPYGDYCYFDMTDEKVRVVVLNGFNSSMELANGLEQQVIGDAQLSWVTNTALNVPDITDWRVLFITHLHPTEYLDNGTVKGNGIAFYNAIEAFINNGGNVLGILHGHQHADTYYTKLETRSWKINFIGVNKGFTLSHNTFGTKNAYSVSIFTIDTVNEKIYETKLGIGSNREFSFEPTTEIPVAWGQT